EIPCSSRRTAANLNSFVNFLRDNPMTQFSIRSILSLNHLFQKWGQVQYLTYVVWAISPEGRAQNLGELDLDGSNKGKLTSSTPLQAFAMIVTAEPYYSVTQPSDIVVMENFVGPGTVGKVQEVNATYELLPRKPYTFDMSAQPKAGDRAVGKEEYEATVALYQALNAIQIATSQQGDKYAPDQMARARAAYNKARGYPISLSKEIVSLAREATQIAEDGRSIAARRALMEKAAGETRARTP
ncbi:MAG TPA: anti-sigma factor, partial [Bryobacteraceae bacterium]|nr:anti-sigma factor [Bryobacteraceae bacterium]